MPASARRTVLRSVASHLAATPAAEKSVESPVLAKLGAVERYKYVTGKEPLIQGLWPAFITPLTADGEVDVAAVKPLCDYLIDECGVRLQLPKLPVMTAQCFFHNFFARESFRRHDRFVVAQACLFLAAKVEESAVSLRSLVRECHGVRYAGKSRAPLDESSERDVKRSVVMAERAVLYARRGVFSLALRSASRRWRVAATARWFYTAVTPSTRRVPPFSPRESGQTRTRPPSDTPRHASN